MSITEFLATASRVPDRVAVDTYAGVGRTLSSWERVEFALAKLYSAFVGLPNGEAASQYGSGQIYKSRCDVLKRAANNHFITNCSQKWEGEFHDLCADCDELSGIRNKVAHGVVIDTSEFSAFRALHEFTDGEARFLLLPSPYLGSRYPMTVTPSFFFSSQTLSEIASAFLSQEERIDGFRLTCPSLLRS